jgi:hypothetical protein
MQMLSEQLLFHDAVVLLLEQVRLHEHFQKEHISLYKFQEFLNKMKK